MSAECGVRSAEWDVAAAGAVLVWDHSGDQPKPMLPKDSTAELVEFVKAHREQVIAAAMDRWGRAPMSAECGVRSAEWKRAAVRRRVERYARAQTAETAAWLEARRNTTEACVALVEWQLAHKRDPVGFVVDLE